MKLIKQATWLPIFPGFYETGFDESDYYIESMYSNEDEFKEYCPELTKAGMSHGQFLQDVWSYVDFKKYRQDCAEQIAHSLLDLNHVHIIKDVDYEGLSSPKYYNFSNDAIYVKITYDADALKAYVNSHLKEFKEFIVPRYTRRDGFIPSYTSDVEIWLDDVNSDNLGEHELGTVLEFVINNEHGQDNEAVWTLHEASELYGIELPIDFDKMLQDFKKKKAV